MARKISRRSLLAAGAAAAVAPAASGAATKSSVYKLVREIPVEQGYDLVVGGGGPAGTAAAVCAARLGAKVLLVEATGCLGGMGTSGLVSEFDSMSDGERTIIRGFMHEIVTTMYQRGFLAPQVTPRYWEGSAQAWTPFSAEGLKLVLDEFVLAAGVEVRFFTKIIDADVAPSKNSLLGVILHNIEGYRYIKARTFVDATGDAVLANVAGADCREAGRDTPHIMAPTLCSILANIDFGGSYNQGLQQQTVQRVLQQQPGGLTQEDRQLPGVFRMGMTFGNLNGGHLFGLDALRCKSLTDGMILGRKIAQEYLQFYRKHIPGFASVEHVTTAALMGVRESRRIIGEYELREHDFMVRRQFPDQIGVDDHAIDIHPYDTSLAEYERYRREFIRIGRLNPGECFGIPYGVLVPKGWSNLWVAGRCLSADVKVQGAVRGQPPAAMMGQAAGTAAVQSIKTGQPACELDTESLVATLRRAGAYLPQNRTAKNMTRTAG